MASESLLAEALADLLADFNRRNVPYALAGGWAFSALVEPRATTDIDFLILLDHPSRETIQSLLAPLFESLIVHPAPMTMRGISMWRTVGVRHREEVVVDFLLADSSYLQSALARKQQIPLRGQLVPILALEDLILLKMLAGRLQDQADLEKIEARRSELQIDWAYSYHRRAVGRPDNLLDEDPWYVSLGSTAQERAQVYADWLETSVSGKEWEQIRKATQQGRVVGSGSFQDEIGSRIGRRLKGETRGRPKRVDRSEIAL